METMSCTQKADAFYAANPRYQTTVNGQATLSDAGWRAFYQRSPECEVSEALLTFDRFLRLNEHTHPEYSYKTFPGGSTLAPTRAGYNAFIAALPQYANDPSLQNAKFQEPSGPGSDGLTNLSIGMIAVAGIGAVALAYFAGKNSCDCELIEVGDEGIELGESDFLDDDPTEVDLVMQPAY